MFSFSRNSRLLIGLALLFLLITTRGHHFASLHHLPSASWAVFFLGGLYLGRRGYFALLMASAVALDLIAVTWGGVSNFCVTAAYPALLAAYGALWGGGMVVAYLGRNAHSNSARLALFTPAALCLLASFALCELISSGCFYLFSGYFNDHSLTEFGQRLIAYGPRNLTSMLWYVGGALVVHCLLLGLGWRPQAERQS